MGDSLPKVGVDYPGSYAELLAWFPDDATCLDYLDWLRWPDGYCCPHCASTVGWKLSDGRWSCGGCRRRVSATAGTIFHGTRTPLTLWFAAAWHMTSQKHGISALGLKRVLELGSEQTAWTMLHRFRTAMVRPGRDRLSGTVEVDETFVGGPEPGRPGAGALSKTLVAIGIEYGPDGVGLERCRLQIIEDTKMPTLKQFLRDHVEPGSTVISDGHSSYIWATGFDYDHQPRTISNSGKLAHELLPGVHRVAALVKRWLLGTHQGGVKPEHLQSYLDEFCFRFNRRHSRARGMIFFRLLEYAIQAQPRTYRSLVAGTAVPRRSMPRPPADKRVRPDSLHRDPENRPWRRDEA